MTPLQRRCCLLLRAYPAWYRRERAGEMLGTLLEASLPGRSWPSVRDARALVIGGLRVRGLVWCLSMLWASIGAAGAGYCFLVTTKPYTDSSIWLPGWNTEPLVIGLAVALAVLAWLALPIPVLVAGFIRIGDRTPGRWFCAVAWAGAWGAGFELMYLAYAWSNYPSSRLAEVCGMDGCRLSYYGPAVVSWGELAICAAWLALGAAMSWILARPASVGLARQAAVGDGNLGG